MVPDATLLSLTWLVFNEWTLLLFYLRNPLDLQINLFYKLDMRCQEHKLTMLRDPTPLFKVEPQN